ncbi:hypothetical protein WJX74_009853 [Apatococcus lobatus]|uniref:Era-type G domain-containing protein n=1 Tax=Apatococcus lobatus TaxID=904363 RepID=A0AAW1RRU3_9CHLO
MESRISVHGTTCGVLTPPATNRLPRQLPQAIPGRAQIQRGSRELARCPRDCACQARVKRPRSKAPEPPLELEEGESLPEDLEGPDFSVEDPPGHRTGYVALIGWPNAGKSTLLNAMLGQKLSIVTRKAQTTRHKLLGILSEPDYQMILFDTPGIIQHQKNELDKRMMGNVQQAMKDSEAMLAVIDAAHKPLKDLAALQPGPDWSGPPLAMVLNKVDLLTPQQQADLKQHFLENSQAEEVFLASAAGGGGVAAIRDWAASKLPEGPSLYSKEVVSERPERFFLAEILREKVFEQYRQEIPYCSTVQVYNYIDRQGNGKDLVEANIVVEREAHRPIILGREGSALKKLSTAARLSMESFLGKGVYLDLSVKVQDKWRDSSQSVQQLGY